MSSKNKYNWDYKPNEGRLKKEWVIPLLGILVLVAGVWWLYQDSKKHQTVIDETQNIGFENTIGNVESRMRFVEEDFELETPAGWHKVSTPEVFVDTGNFYPTRFEGKDESQVGRRLDVYAGAIPALLPVNKVVSVRVKGNEIIPSSISPYCYTYTNVPEFEVAANHPSIWEGQHFICQPSATANDILALAGDAKEGIVLTNGTKTKKFLLVWRDHGSRMNDSLFLETLKSFKVR